ncbi:MAG: hypothetical protein FWH54_06915 [Methanobrevibacter sp.]|nr:hypothetical protein [Methanobrevibacter sp.]
MPTDLKNKENKKTESYNFRTTPKIMEDLRNYAKVTNKTIPTIINRTLKEKFKNKTLTRKQDTTLSLPVYSVMSEKEVKEFGNEKYSSEYCIEHNGIWYSEMNFAVFYNNYLDIWKDDTYQSTRDTMMHDGLALTNSEYKHFVKIDHYPDGKIISYIIPKELAIKLAHASENDELMDIVENYCSEEHEKLKQETPMLQIELSKFLEEQKMIKENKKLKQENKKLKQEIEKLKKSQK